MAIYEEEKSDKRRTIPNAFTNSLPLVSSQMLKISIPLALSFPSDVRELIGSKDN